jgi:hypothetical protein
MIELFDGTINVHYGQAYFEAGAHFEGNLVDSFVGQRNGIIGAARPGMLYLITGLHTGAVGLAIYLNEREPELDPIFDEVVEVSLEVSAPAMLMEWGADDGTSLALPQGDYRVRYQARDMQAGNEQDTSEYPIDTYRLDLWPAPPAPDRIIKQSSEIAAYWHNWATALGAN